MELLLPLLVLLEDPQLPLPLPLLKTAHLLLLLLLTSQQLLFLSFVHLNSFRVRRNKGNSLLIDNLVNKLLKLRTSRLKLKDNHRLQTIIKGMYCLFQWVFFEQILI